MLALGVLGLGEDQAGAGLPVRSALRPEQPVGLAGRPLASAGRPAAAAVAAEQAPLLYASPPSGEPSARSFSSAASAASPAASSARSGRQRDRAWSLRACRNDSLPRRGRSAPRKVAAAKSYTSAVVPGLGVLEFLPAGGVHLLRPANSAPRPGQPEPERPRLDVSATGPPILCPLSGGSRPERGSGPGMPHGNDPDL